MESMGKQIMSSNDEMKSKPRKPYQRLSPEQTQYLERYFNVCPHPDEKLRAELSNQLDLTQQQIKFWFQNRRTMIKGQESRSETCMLRQENQMLRDENMLLRHTLTNATCETCIGRQGVERMISNIKHYQHENQILRQEIENASAIARAYLGEPRGSDRH